MREPLAAELLAMVERYRHRASCSSTGDYRDGYADAVEDMVSDVEQMLGIHAGRLD